MRFQTISIRFVDPALTRAEHKFTRKSIGEGVLNLYRKNGEISPEEHVASYVLQHVFSWVET